MHFNNGRKRPDLALRNKLFIRSGWKHTSATKKKISEAHKGERNIFSNPEMSARMSLIRHGKKLSESHRLAIKKGVIARFKKNPEMHPNRLCAKLGKVSKPQLEMYYRLKEYFPDAELNCRIIGTLRHADVGVASLKLDFEYDSNYWHNPEKDKIRDVEILRVGWQVFRLHEGELFFKKQEF